MSSLAASRMLGFLLYPLGLREAGPGARIAFPRRLRGHRCIRIGARSRVASHVWLEAVTGYGAQRFSPCISIGSDVSMGRHVTITATTRIEIGDGCELADGVYISDTAHDVAGLGAVPLARRPLVFKGAVHIGPRCSLGLRACVMPGVTLGERCVVLAHSVVTRSFGPGTVLAGVPARPFPS